MINMNFNLETYLIDNATSYIAGAKYLKTMFNGNKERYIKRFEKVLESHLQMNDVKNVEDIIFLYSDLFDKVDKFSYKEAFNIKLHEFRIEVFSVINVPEMILELGSDRIKTDGIELINKTFNKFKDKFETKKLTQVYELHKVNGEKLGLKNEDIYAIKCWCTSTNQEHWLWVNEEIGNLKDPLEAIASTCKIYKSMENKIKHIIRQGDVFLFEMLDDDIIINEDDDIISLTKDTYFKLLKSQS